MDWSGLLWVVVALMRMFDDEPPSPPDMDGGEDWKLCGMFIVVPNEICGVSCLGEREWEEARPKLWRFGQLDTVRRRLKEAGALRLRKCVVRFIERSERPVERKVGYSILDTYCRCQLSRVCHRGSNSA
mmetsp:Transcript_34695/g.101974  ORF Transcript_34695/g.101974 Transcript_34695/m.101974 type:complete len:129 (+) Transcript_34695:993-1379(+)